MLRLRRFVALPPLKRYSHDMRPSRQPREPLVAIIGATGTGKSDVGYDEVLPKRGPGFD